MAEDLRLDLAEVAALVSQATRPSVRAHLSAFESALREQLAAVEAIVEPVVEAPAPEPEPVDEAVPEAKEATPEDEAVGAKATQPQRWEQLDYAWDAGDYNSPWVSVYISLDGVGAQKEGVSCDFSARAFDLKIRNVGGRSYRVLKSNLAHDVDTATSKVVVKRNRVVVKLRKKETEYGGFEHWGELVAKRNKTPAAEKDPSAGIMDLMRDMYNDGDDNMKKVIGEAMMKAQTNQGGPAEGLDP